MANKTTLLLLTGLTLPFLLQPAIKSQGSTSADHSPLTTHQTATHQTTTHQFENEMSDRPFEAFTIRKQNVGKVHPGMTQGEVRKLLGKPDRTARQILYCRSVEQWSYEDLPGWLVAIDCLKGQEARVQTVLAPQVVKP